MKKITALVYLFFLGYLFFHLPNIALSQTPSFDYKIPRAFNLLGAKHFVAQNQKQKRLLVEYWSNQFYSNRETINLKGEQISSVSDTISHIPLALFSTESLGDTAFVGYYYGYSRVNPSIIKLYQCFYSPIGERISVRDITSLFISSLGFDNYKIIGLEKCVVQQPISTTFLGTNGSLVRCTIGKVFNDSIVEPLSEKSMLIELNADIRKIRWVEAPKYDCESWKDFQNNWYIFDRIQTDSLVLEVKKVDAKNNVSRLLLRTDSISSMFTKALQNIKNRERYYGAVVFPHRTNGYLLCYSDKPKELLGIGDLKEFSVQDTFPSTRVVHIDSTFRLLHSNVLPGRFLKCRELTLQWFGENNYVIGTSKLQFVPSDTVEDDWFAVFMSPPLRNDALLLEFDSTLIIKKEALFTGKYNDTFTELLSTNDNTILAVGAQDWLRSEVKNYGNENNLWIVRLNENLEPNTSVGVRESSQTLSPNVVHTFYSNGVLHISDSQCINNENSVLTVYDVVGKEIFRGRTNAQRLEVGNLQAGVYAVVQQASNGCSTQSTFVVPF